MRIKIIHFLSGLWLTVLLLVIAACSCGNNDVEVPVGKLMVSIGFKVHRASVDGYVEGETYENYIDVLNDNYRIYFFGNDNKFIARLEGKSVSVVEGTDYKKYEVSGTAPSELIGRNSFKIVVLANWPDYNDAGLVKGATTIEEICSSTTAQFDSFKASGLGPGGRLIPFYGVQEYSNVEFKTNELTALTEPVSLLRAVAKVEVILDADKIYGLSFSQVMINRYNSKGYCAPIDVYSQSDYVHNSWESDYVGDLHLVGEANDTGEKQLSLTRVDSCELEGKLYERWIAYLPEYKNIGEEYYSNIKVKFKHQRENELPYDIYFAKYTNGKADNDDGRLNIERNNLYRFKVSVDPLLFKVTVEQWQLGGKVDIDM